MNGGLLAKTVVRQFHLGDPGRPIVDGRLAEILVCQDKRHD